MEYILPESYGYLIVLGIGAFMALVVTFLIKAEIKWLGTKNTLEWFSTAGRNIKTGLIAVSVVSAWTWAATLLQSSTVAYQFGIAGPFWYAAGASIQIILFGILAVGLKRHAPHVHTFPEIIKKRFGKSAHKVFLFFALMTNTIVTSMLLLGGAAVINSLTGIDIGVAAFMIPIGIIVYTFFGGLKGTFLADYANASFLFVIVFIFVAIVYFSSPEIGGISGMYDKLTNAATLNPVIGNSLGSYLTLASIGALAFGIINIVGNFGTVFVDQSYWLRAIAAKPTAASKGFILGGLAWFAIPFALATALGLSAVALNIQLSEEEIGLGLVAPSGAYAVLGDVGAILLLAILFTAVTAAGSAQLTAVSTLSVYDVYKTYLKPSSTDTELFRKSRLLIVGFGLGMGLLASLLLQLGMSLQYVYLVMGILIGSAVMPIAATLMWKKTHKYSAIFGAIGGLIAGVAVWLGVTFVMYGDISVQTTGNEIPLLLGNITSISVGAIVCIFGSILSRAKRGYETGSPIHLSTKSNVNTEERILDKSSRFAKRYALLFSVILVVVWPLPLFFSGHVLSEIEFHVWIATALVWVLGAAVTAIVLPVVESKEGIVKVMRSAAVPMVFAGIVGIAVVTASYLYAYEAEQRSALLQLVNTELGGVNADPALVSAIQDQGWYTLTFTCILLGIAGTFSCILVVHNARLGRLVQVRTEELKKAGEDLLKKDRLKDEFMRIAAHELRTPVQPILGFSDLAMRGIIEPEMAMDKIHEEARRLRQITQDILDVSRFDTDNIEYRIERVNIVQLLSSIIDSMRLQAPPDVVLEAKFDARISQIFADKTRLAQVFSNLIGNALKFTSQGFIRIETFYIALTRDLRIEFRDTGPGIPDAQIPKLFEKFATMDIENKNRSGTGLGLYICRKIVERHGGQIEAYNNDKGGATFAVILPTRSSEKARISANDSAETKGTAQAE
jgi:SSS family transporter